MDKNKVQRVRKRDHINKTNHISSSAFLITLSKIVKKLKCAKTFILTLSISNAPLKNAFSVESDVTGQFVGLDNRGRKQPPNKTSEDWVIKIKDHIRSFATMESHYCRKDTKKSTWMQH